MERVWLAMHADVRKSRPDVHDGVPSQVRVPKDDAHTQGRSVHHRGSLHEYFEDCAHALLHPEPERAVPTHLSTRLCRRQDVRQCMPRRCRVQDNELRGRMSWGRRVSETRTRRIDAQREIR